MTKINWNLFILCKNYIISCRNVCMLFFFCNFRTFLRGEMLEWLKRHAWKACIRQKCIAGSNPAFSAVTAL